MDEKVSQILIDKLTEEEVEQVNNDYKQNVLDPLLKSSEELRNENARLAKELEELKSKAPDVSKVEATIKEKDRTIQVKDLQLQIKSAYPHLTQAQIQAVISLSPNLTFQEATAQIKTLGIAQGPTKTGSIGVSATANTQEPSTQQKNIDWLAGIISNKRK